MRVKTLGSLGSMQRPDTIDLSRRGISGFGDPGGDGAFGGPVVTEAAGQTSLTWDNDKGWVPRSMARNPVKWLLGAFALGWLGGYATWRVLARR